MYNENIEKKKLSKKKIFIIVSILFFMILLITYTIRLVYYYRLEHKKVSNDINSNKLYNHIINDNYIVTSNNGLYEKNGKYIFKGKVKNNYLYYSNRLWRIVSIDKDKTIKIITDDIQGSLVFNYEGADYKNSYIRNWLNLNDNSNSGIFYKSLNSPEKYLENKNFCADRVDQKDYNSCNEKIKDKIGLLTYKEYLTAKAYDSYLNIGKYFWLINGTKDNKNWYVFDEGGVNSNSYNGDIYYGYGVRPVINLKKNIDYISGKGTKEEPYKIENDNTLNSGSYLKYSDYTWKVISKDENVIKLVMDDSIKVNNQYLTKNYSLIDSNFNPNRYDNIAYYLNHNFYNSLKNKNYIVDGNWFIGSYNYKTKYDYNNIYTSSVVSKIGLLNASDLFVTDIATLTITPESSETIYLTTSKANLFAEDINTKLLIRPAINITSQIKIIKGNGTKEEPYIIEE